MNRPYTAHSPYSLTPTERIDTYSVDDLGELDYDEFHEYPEDGEFAESADYDEARIDRRWMWIAGIAGAILFVAIGTTGIILGGGDSGSVSATATSGAPTTSAAPVTSVPAAAPLRPAPQAAPPAAAPPGTVTYRITGSRQLIDLVTVIYTDQQGALMTDVNVALPWTKTVVLNPGVTLSSVTATSIAGQLNCSIVDANGALIATQNNNSIITNCTR